MSEVTTEPAPEHPATLELPRMNPRDAPQPAPEPIDPDDLDMYERGWCPQGDVIPGYVGRRHAIIQDYGNGVMLLADGGPTQKEILEVRRRRRWALGIFGLVIIAIVITLSIEFTNAEKKDPGLATVTGLLTTGYCKSDINYDKDAGGFCQEWVNGTNSLDG